MSVQNYGRTMTAGLLACVAMAFAIERGLAQEPTALPGKGPVTLVGCLQQTGKHNDKYFLANPSTNIVTSVSDPACTPDGGQMIELEGIHKLHLDPSIGHWVEMSGKLEGSHHKPELRVKSFRQVPVVIVRAAEAPPATAAPAPPPVAAAPEPPAPTITPAPEEKPAATTGTLQTAKLPRTASPLPAIGLLSLMSLGLGVGLHLFRRREQE